MVARDASMLEAKKNKLFERIFRAYNTNLLRRKFDSFRVSGLENLRGTESIPQIVVANHTGWWDGLAGFELWVQSHRDNFVMMEEKQLSRFWPFTRLGAFSVVRENPRAAAKSIDYAARILNERRNRSLWIFPQGELVPFGTRPMKLFPGFARVIERVGECEIVPVTFRYEFFKAHRPVILGSIESPFKASVSGRKQRDDLVEQVTRRLCESEDRLKDIVLSGNIPEEFTEIL